MGIIAKPTQRNYKLIHNSDDSVTVTCGAWIMLRRFADGRILEIALDAPAVMMQEAYKAIEHLS